MPNLLVKAAADSPETGLLSPHIVSMTRPPRPWYVVGRSLAVVRDSGQARRRSDIEGPGSPREVDYATGCGMLIRPAWSGAGALDARFLRVLRGLDFSLGPGMPASGFSSCRGPGCTMQWPTATDCPEHLLQHPHLLEVMRRHGTCITGLVSCRLPRGAGSVSSLPCSRACGRGPSSPALRQRSGRLCERPARERSPGGGGRARSEAPE